MNKEKNHKRICLIFLALIVIAVMGIVFWNLIRKEGDKELLEGQITKGELDPEVKKLSEINANFADHYYIKMRDYSDDKGEYIFVSDSEVVKHIIENINSIYVKECDPVPYRKRGFAVKICSDDGARVNCEFDILDKNKNGNYILGLEVYNEKVAEVEEGELDFDYLNKVYSEYKEKADEKADEKEKESL